MPHENVTTTLVNPHDMEMAVTVGEEGDVRICRSSNETVVTVQ